MGDLIHILGATPATREEAARRVKEQLAKGLAVDDALFDSLLPANARAVAEQYWTPVEVAVLAAQWLEEARVRTVLDIGSGVGKFGVVAGLCSELEVAGVEHRPTLVEFSNELAALFGLQDRVYFIEGDFSDGDLPEADALYLYNPFGENLFRPDEFLDDDVELSANRYSHDVSAVQALLLRVPIGTRLLLYNGFGGRVREPWVRVRKQHVTSNALELWEKVALEDWGRR